MPGKFSNLIKTICIRCFYHPKVQKDKWIFSSVDNCCYNYNSKYLFEYVIKNCPEIQPKFVINDRALREKLRDELGRAYFIESESADGIKEILSASVWFTSAGLPLYGFGLGKKHLIVNLWHGVPLKKIALLENGISRFNRLYFKYIFSGNYSCILTTSEKLVGIMAESFGVPENMVKPWGQPRNDCLLSEAFERHSLNTVLGQLPDHQACILYAPTYRDHAGTKLFPFDDFSSDKLERFLEANDILLLLRAHISETAGVGIPESGRVRYLNEDRLSDVTEVLPDIDLLITDYSSIFIDYLLTERPVVFLPYDIDAYERERGFNFPYEDITPGPRPQSFEALREEISRLLADSGYYAKERHEVNCFFNEVQSPCSGAIVTAVQDILKGKDL